MCCLFLEIVEMDIKKWDDILEEVLQCCVCLDIPIGLISQCASGHHICHFCKSKLRTCPLCKDTFIPTRNLLAEDLSQKMKDIKISIAKEIVEKLETMKCEKQFADISTQTNLSLSANKKCSTTQTDKMIDIGCEEKSYATKEVVFYPCLIGACTLRLSFLKLLEHLKERHKDMFYEVRLRSKVFNEKFIVDIDMLPKQYKYAFHINNMGLFFFKLTIDNNRELISSLQIVDSVVTNKQFEYFLVIQDETHVLRRRGMVISCLSKNEMDYQNNVHIHEKGMWSLIQNGKFECMLHIQRYIPRK